MAGNPMLWPCKCGRQMGRCPCYMTGCEDGARHATDRDYLAERCPKCLARNGDHLVGIDIIEPQCPPAVPAIAADSSSAGTVCTRCVCACDCCIDRVRGRLVPAQFTRATPKEKKT